MTITKIKFLTLLFLLLQFAGFAQLNKNSIKISDDIEIIRLSDKAFLYVSYFEMPPYGKIGANGLALVDKGKAFLFDSPWNDTLTETLVNFIEDSFHAKISGFVPNHWHNDCMGGLAYLNKKGVKSYANQMTIDIAKKKGLPVPEQGFKDSLSLKLNNIEIDFYYLGEAHSTDNIVAWIPSEKILFGGCMVKDLQSATLGNLSDANVAEWSKTIQKLINKFPSAKIVIPGHGQIGGKKLLKHTQKLLTEKNN